MVCVVCSELESEFSSLHFTSEGVQLCMGHSAEAYWRRGICCWSLGRSWKFCWVLSATLTPALGLRLLLSSSSADTSPTRVTVGWAAWPLAGAAPRSTPSLQRAGTPPNRDPSSSLSLAAGVLIKHLGFIFVCMCVCVCGAVS